MMINLSKEDEELVLHVQPNFHVILVAILCVGVTLAVLSKLRRRSQIRSASTKPDIPGRLGLPFIGETLSFFSAAKSKKGCYDFVTVRRNRYGKWFKTRLFGKNHVFVPSTEGAKMMYSNDFVHFRKEFIKPMRDIVGKKSLFVMPQEGYKRIRSLLADPFSMPSLSKYVKKFDAMVCERLKKAEQGGKSFSAQDFCMKLTFDAICDVLMSIRDEPLLQQMEKDLTDISAGLLSFPLMIPGTSYYKGIKAKGRLMGFFSDIIGRRRSGEEVHEDFLQAILRRDSYPPEEKLDDIEIMDNLMTLIISGRTTTASAMMWSVKFLDESQSAQDRLRAESISIAKDHEQSGAPLSMEDVNSMAYGLKVMKETLRMCNIILWYPRVALKDCDIDGFHIKKGWHVNVDVTHIHYDPAIYKDPTSFNPSRFEEMQKPYSFIPFGAGQRLCLGISMAKVTMLVFQHRLTSGYKWTVDDQDRSMDPNSFIPRLRNGCPITLKALNQ